MSSSPATHATGRAAPRPLLLLVATFLAVAAAAAGLVPDRPRALATGAPVVTPPPQVGAPANPSVVTAFDARTREVTRLDPALREALRRAAVDAVGDGVTFVVNSGWRSPERQEQLLEDAVAEYGSRSEAARWVATPETSPHVSGRAVDLGGSGTTGWLSEHGSRYGLCQIYRNEPWHYELRPDAVTHGCPPMYADPSRDPRLRR
ncbi:M15 family metallopeptidase [Knoellia sp. LjRoot47]|uniref:M15 family metallopeptidase n=1 Tax=Knoellia sp. LjRoot47 TaxID=3342330 RepID=UPI003ECE17D3